MGIIEIFLIGVGVAMDAFAISICKGLSMTKLYIKNMVIVALYLSFFQTIMPLLGYYVGNVFESFIISVDHWLSLILLSIIGINMMKEAFSEETKDVNDKIDFKTMSLLGIATSIDALTVGITFACLNTNVCVDIFIIGSTTFIVTFIGTYIGNKVGSKYEKSSQLFGGIVLIIIGLKILFEHLTII